MLREKQKFLDRLHIFVGGFLIIASYCVLYWIVSYNSLRYRPLDEYLPQITLFSLIVMIVMYIRNFNISDRLIVPFVIFRELFTCYIFGALFAFGFFVYVFKFPPLSRLYLLGGTGISYVVLAMWYLVIYKLFRELRANSFNYRHALLVGSHGTISPIIKAIEENKALGIKIAGVLGIDALNPRDLQGHTYFGNIEEIGKVLNSEVIDYAIFAGYNQNPKLMEKAVLECQERGVEVWLKPDFMQSEMAISRVDYFHDMPLLILSLGPKFGLPILIKRLLDIVLSFLLLILLAIPMLLIAMLVRRTTKGPAIFRQKRVGLNGRKFVMYKFRTMHHASEELRAEFRLKNEMKGPAFKMKDDPRITPVGRFLRRYSLDELPQLWNVFIGEMSLVGPRPPLPTEVDLYKGWQRRRLSMRPGITCLWQVKGRNNITDFNEWAKMDLEYITEWSLELDFKILLLTIPAVFKGTGL